MYVRVSITFKIMSMDAYYQYLQRAFEAVLVTSLEDESLTLLKEMENKNYYFARLQEIFAETYEAQREKKIQELLQQIEKMEEKLQSPKAQGGDIPKREEEH